MRAALSLAEIHQLITGPAPDFRLAAAELFETYHGAGVDYLNQPFRRLGGQSIERVLAAGRPAEVKAVQTMLHETWRFLASGCA